VLGLLVFRVVWGFVGSSTAQFANFIRGPAIVWRYGATLAQRAPSNGVGHNPIGALSVVALLLVVGSQVVTGLFAVDVDGLETGPLSDRVSFDQGRWFAELHNVSFTTLQALVVLHLAAVLFYLLYKRDNLIGPMITGRRRTTGAAMKRAPAWQRRGNIMNDPKSSLEVGTCRSDQTPHWLRVSCGRRLRRRHRPSCP
jgi:cytochrome b